MFALEITFKDGISQPEMIHVRRPLSLIGSSDSAHVVVEDMRDLNFQLLLTRHAGRKFRVRPLAAGTSTAIPAALDAVYDGESNIDLDKVKFHITALDTDLLVREGEALDRSGIRVLRQACSLTGPKFPAMVAQHENPVVISFNPTQPLFAGRSKYCPLRLDFPEVSSKHARLGFESGKFWVEDLGSTNGTFIGGQQVSGRVNVEPLQPITLGREVTILGVANEEQLARAIGGQREIERKPAVQEKRFPALISVSEVARPARFLLAPGATVTVGRDPGCDLWLGAPHISRNHCSITFSKTGNLILTDTSTNGTAHDGGILRRGDTLDIKNPKVLDFGGGVTVAICFKLEDERQFAASSGSIWSFTQEGPVRARRFTKGMQAIAAAGDGAGGSPVEALSHFERFKAFCSGLGLMGKVMLSVIVALLGVLCAVVFFLLVSVVR